MSSEDIIEEKKRQYEYRIRCWKQNALTNPRVGFVQPTNVQFDVKTYDDLNDDNKKKFNRLVKTYGSENMLSEIRKYDTSVLDVLFYEGQIE